MVIDIFAAQLVLSVYGIDRVTIALAIGGVVFLLGAALSVRHMK